MQVCGSFSYSTFLYLYAPFPFFHSRGPIFRLLSNTLLVCFGGNNHHIKTSFIRLYLHTGTFALNTAFTTIYDLRIACHFRNVYNTELQARMQRLKFHKELKQKLQKSSYGGWMTRLPFKNCEHCS